MEIDKDQAEMNKHLARIDRALTSPWRSFVRGTFQGLGSIVGAAIILVIIGWVLNMIGVYPAFKESVAEFRQLLIDVRGR